jgi:hypothetical protein
VHELHPDVISNNNYAVLTPEMRRLYPGAVALGPKERISSVAELDQLCVDDELDVQEEEPEDPPLDSIPEYPDRTLPEFEEEGFGLKKYFGKVALSDEDVDRFIGLVDSETSEVLGIDDAPPHTGNQGARPPSISGCAGASSAGSGEQTAAEHDSIGALEADQASRM